MIIGYNYWVKTLLIQDKDKTIGNLNSNHSEEIKKINSSYSEEIKKIISNYQEQIKDINDKYNFKSETLICGKNNEKNGKNTDFCLIKSTGTYRICVYGAKAIKGGRGGKQCAQHLFKKDSKIKIYFEGQEDGGEGGKGCGLNGGKGFNGAGLSMASYEEEFLIVAGGGGGDSEGSKNKGGDFEKDGDGLNGGKGGNKNIIRGEMDKTDKTKGGKGGSNGDPGSYCGGGGGNGYIGGEGGGYGDEKNVGGGGGGSNYCKADDCYEEINYFEYSGYFVYKKNK